MSQARSPEEAARDRATAFFANQLLTQCRDEALQEIVRAAQQAAQTAQASNLEMLVACANMLANAVAGDPRLAQLMAAHNRMVAGMCAEILRREAAQRAAEQQPAGTA